MKAGVPSLRWYGPGAVVFVGVVVLRVSTGLRGGASSGVFAMVAVAVGVGLPRAAAAVWAAGGGSVADWTARGGQVRSPA